LACCPQTTPFINNTHINIQPNVNNFDDHPRFLPPWFIHPSSSSSSSASSLLCLTPSHPHSSLLSFILFTLIQPEINLMEVLQCFKKSALNVDLSNPWFWMSVFSIAYNPFFWNVVARRGTVPIAFLLI
jgi:hypothetical protein